MPDQQFQMMQQQQSLPMGAVSQSEFDGACGPEVRQAARFKVDIETDSTHPVDRMQDQQNRIAFIGAVGQYLSGVILLLQLLDGLLQLRQLLPPDRRPGPTLRAPLQLGADLNGTDAARAHLIESAFLHSRDHTG